MLLSESFCLIFTGISPGVKLIPMASRTAKPFCTTNLIVFFPETSSDGSRGDSFIACGEALVVDTGCKSALYKARTNSVNRTQYLSFRRSYVPY